MADTTGLQARLADVLVERDRLFPLWEHANAEAMKAAFAEYTAAIEFLRRLNWRPDAGLTARAREYLPRAIFICGEMKSGTTMLVNLLDEVHRRLYPDSADRMFAFHSPGSQLDFFLNQLGTRAWVVITLRHPIQNYLAPLAHVLQKGEGYRPAEKLLPEVGLTSMLHLNLFRLFSAFQAALLRASDERVLVTRLEDFTTQVEERQRVWAFLGLAVDPILERITRGGQTSDARSGPWQSSEIVPVRQDAYQEPLTETERCAFESGARWWAPFYPDALHGLVGRRDTEAVAVFYQREGNCLLQDRHAQNRREERVAAVLGRPPRWLGGLMRQPRRAIKTLYRKHLALPRAQMQPRRAQLGKLQHNLEEVATLVGAVDGGSK